MKTQVPGLGSKYSEEVEMEEVVLVVVGVLSLKLDSTRDCFCQVRQSCIWLGSLAVSWAMGIWRWLWLGCDVMWWEWVAGQWVLG